MGKEREHVGERKSMCVIARVSGVTIRAPESKKEAAFEPFFIWHPAYRLPGTYCFQSLLKPILLFSFHSDICVLFISRNFALKTRTENAHVSCCLPLQPSVLLLLLPTQMPMSSLPFSLSPPLAFIFYLVPSLGSCPPSPREGARSIILMPCFSCCFVVLTSAKRKRKPFRYLYYSCFSCAQLLFSIIHVPPHLPSHVLSWPLPKPQIIKICIQKRREKGTHLPSLPPSFSPPSLHSLPPKGGIQQIIIYNAPSLPPSSLPPSLPSYAPERHISVGGPMCPLSLGK